MSPVGDGVIAIRGAAPTPLSLARHGKPDIVDADRGSQYTSGAFIGLLLKNGIAIGMDSKGAWRDNVFVERLWRSVEYAEAAKRTEDYLKACDSLAEARGSIREYLEFHNRNRPHSSLNARTPARPASTGRCWR